MFRSLFLRTTPSLWRPASRAAAHLATPLSRSPQFVEVVQHVTQASDVKLAKKLLRPRKISLQQYLRGPETDAEEVVKTMCTTCRAPSSVRDDEAPKYLIADGRYVVRRQPCYGTCPKSEDDVNLCRLRARKYHVPVDHGMPRVFCTSLARAIRMTLEPEAESGQRVGAKSSKGEPR